MPKYSEVDWDSAECRDIYTDLFYRVEEERNALAYLNINALRSICARCPIWKACLTYALENEQYGVWGGLTSIERQAVKNPEKYPQQRQRALKDLRNVGISHAQIKECL